MAPASRPAWSISRSSVDGRAGDKRQRRNPGLNGISDAAAESPRAAGVQVRAIGQFARQMCRGHRSGGRQQRHHLVGETRTRLHAPRRRLQGLASPARVHDVVERRYCARHVAEGCARSGQRLLGCAPFAERDVQWCGDAPAGGRVSDDEAMPAELGDGGDGMPLALPQDYGLESRGGRDQEALAGVSGRFGHQRLHREFGRSNCPGGDSAIPHA